MFYQWKTVLNLPQHIHNKSILQMRAMDCRPLHKMANSLPQFGLFTVVGNLYQEDTCSRWASDLFDSNSKSLYNLLLLGKNYLLSRAVASATQRRTRNLG